MAEPRGTQFSVSADSDELITGEAVALDVRSTSFILRAAGTIIDVLVSVLIMFVIFWIAIALLLQGVIDPSWMGVIQVSTLVLGCVVIPTAVETLMRGRSLGKLAIGARIVRDDGGAIGFRHAFIRALTGVLEIYMTLGGLAALTGLLNRRSKRIGDYLAGTYSQQERVPRTDQAVVGLPPALSNWAAIADVGRMPDALSRRIAQFLKQAPKMTPGTRARLSQELAREASAFVSPLPTAPPEIFLYGVAALRRDREFEAMVLERERLAKLQPVLGGLPHGFPERG